MRSLIAFIPSELYLILLVGAAFAVIVGAKRFAGTIFLIVLAGILLPLVVAPLFDQLPAWLLVLLLAFLGLGVLRTLFALFLGKRATDTTVGILAADAIKAILAIPFHILRYVLKLLFTR